MTRDTAATDSLSSAASLAASFIRSTFYLLGSIALAASGVALIWFWSQRVHVVQGTPAFRITDGDVSRLPVKSDVITGGQLGRVEVMQYGSLFNRGTDMTVVMTFPEMEGVQTRPGTELRDTNLLHDARVIMLPTHYDLDTRYGPVHAAEMRIETDGRWKQYLAFRTRFETRAIILTGWTCDGTGSKPGAAALACALDKLVIDRDLASKEADTFMRTRMAKPASCAAQEVTQTFDTGSRPVSPPSRWSQPTARTRLR